MSASFELPRLPPLVTSSPTIGRGPLALPQAPVARPGCSSDEEEHCTAPAAACVGLQLQQQPEGRSHAAPTPKGAEAGLLPSFSVDSTALPDMAALAAPGAAAAAGAELMVSANSTGALACSGTLPLLPPCMCSLALGLSLLRSS